MKHYQYLTCEFDTYCRSPFTTAANATGSMPFSQSRRQIARVSGSRPVFSRLEISCSTAVMVHTDKYNAMGYASVINAQSFSALIHQVIELSAPRNSAFKIRPKLIKIN